MSATSLRALHTVVAVPSSHKASYAAKKDVTDFLNKKKDENKREIVQRFKRSYTTLNTRK